MIRDYFSRLLAETAEHPHIAIEDVSDAAKKARRDHDSAQREAIGKMKQFASWFTHGVPNGAHLRRAIFEAKRADDVIAKVDAFFAARSMAREDGIEEPVDNEDLVAAPASWG